MSKTLALVSFVIGDLIEYRTGFSGHWRPGWVRAIETHVVTVEDGYSHRTAAIDLGRKGKVRALHGAKMVDSLASIQAAEHRQKLPQAALLPAIRPIVVRTTGQPRAVPAPRARYRSRGFLAFVRTFPCLHCAAPAPSEAHHVGPRGVGQVADDYGAVPLCAACHRGPQGVTDTHCLPGLSQAETEQLVQAAQVRLLIEWAGMVSERAA